MRADKGTAHLFLTSTRTTNPSDLQGKKAAKVF